MSVKNGAELLDRLMKDIVAEAAPNYVSIYPSNINPDLPASYDLPSKVNGLGISPPTGEKDRGEEKDTSPEARHGSVTDPVEEDKRAFSLARFIPLLAERVYVISPYTRMHLVSWLMVLDSVPDLELVAWLPEFLDGLLYVSPLAFFTSPATSRLSLLADVFAENTSLTAILMYG